MKFLNSLRRIFSTPAQRAEFDKSLIVSFLSAHRGEQTVSDICWYMRDHTRGEYNWEFRSETRIYRLLDQMEAEGIVDQKPDIIGKRAYFLVAPSNKLMRIP